MQKKEVRGELWNPAPAHWTKFIEPTFIPMYLAALATLDLDEEKMVLDAGCGAGLFLSMVLPTGAALHGIEAAAGLLDVSRRRLPDATLLLEDPDNIPFNDNTFDVVTVFNSFQYGGTSANATREAKRVAKKGGKMVIGSSGTEEDSDAAVVLSRVASLLPPPSPAPADALAAGSADSVETICHSLGLKILVKETVFCPWQFNNVKDLQDAFMCMGSSMNAADIVGTETVKKVIRETSEPFSLADGIYYMRNRFTYFITEKI